MTATGDTGSPAIRVSGLRKSFRGSGGRAVTAVDNVSLTVAAGEMVVLLGPSGCGKTTLLRCIAGLEQPDGGEIEIRGELAFSEARGRNVPPERRALSMMFQSYALWPHMTAFDNVAYPLRARARKRGDVAGAVGRALEMVGVAPLAREYPGRMSGGQQQRVALARALVAGSGLILFDEPLSNVDAKVREELRGELVAMQRELRFAGLYVTHDQSEAMVLGDRVAIVRDGAIVQIGSPRDVYQFPRSRYVARFVGAANEIEGTVVERGADGVAVATAIGDVVGVTQLDALGVEDAAVAIFRPECCRLAEPEAGPRHPNRWRGVVRRVVFAGAHVEVLVDVEGGRLRVWTSAQTAPREGDACVVEVDAATVQVLAT